MTMRNDLTHRARRERRFALAAAILLAIAGAAHVLAAEDVPGDRLPGGALVYQGDALAAVMTVRGQANTDPDHPLFDAVRQALSLQPGELPPGMATALPARPTSLPAWTPARCMEYAQLFEDAGARHGVDPALLLAVAIAESGCQPHVTSHANAQGMMQVVPRWHGTRDWYDPVIAVDYAAQLLASLRRSKGSWGGAVYSYNSGNIRTAEGDRYLRWVGGMWSEADQPASATFLAWCRAGSGFNLPECLGGSS